MRGGVMAGRHRAAPPQPSAQPRQTVRPESRWKARVAFVGAGACAGLVGQAIGLGMLQWPSGGLPGFSWWEPPAAYASPGQGPTPDELPVGLTASPALSSEQQRFLQGWLSPGSTTFMGPRIGPAGSWPASNLPPAFAPAPATPFAPAPQPGGSSVLAAPDVPGVLAQIGGDTAPAVSRDVAPAAREVVGTTGTTGDVGRITTMAGAVADAGRVPGAVVETAGTATTTAIRTVDDTVDDAVEHVPAPQGLVHVVEAAVHEPPVVGTVDDVVRTTKEEPSESGDTDSGSGDPSSDSVAHTVLDTVTSSAHLPR
jgi:hypothetical protein